jgi:hypothetical protein
MGQAVLVWSGGVYKLQLSYPTEQPSVANGLVNSRHVFTDDDILQEETTISYPSAENKFNQVTVRFANSFKNFKQDSVTWPETLSNAHNTFLTEDNFQPLKTQISVPGITNPYHAQAKAEEMVRISRTSATLSVVLSKKALTLEPGDFFIITSEVLQLQDEVFRVEVSKVNEDLSVEIQAYKFDYTTLAWNIENDVSYVGSLPEDFVVPNPTNVLIDFSSATLLNNSSALITWTVPQSATVNSYVIESSSDLGVTWDRLGETSANSFSVPPLNTDDYQFRVRSRTLQGRLSSGVIARDVNNNTSFNISAPSAGAGESLLVVYGDGPDATTNTQKLDNNIGVAFNYIAYYTYTGTTPTLPITTDITFTQFRNFSIVDFTVDIDGTSYGGSQNRPNSMDFTEANNLFVEEQSRGPIPGDRMFVTNTLDNQTPITFVYTASGWNYDLTVKTAIVYGTDANERTNTQSYDISPTAVNPIWATVEYFGELPTLPIRNDIFFSSASAPKSPINSYYDITGYAYFNQQGNLVYAEDPTNQTEDSIYSLIALFEERGAINGDTVTLTNGELQLGPVTYVYNNKEISLEDSYNSLKVWGSTANERTNTQSLFSDPYATDQPSALYAYSGGQPPTLPIREDIFFKGSGASTSPANITVDIGVVGQDPAARTEDQIYDYITTELNRGAVYGDRVTVTNAGFDDYTYIWYGPGTMDNALIESVDLASETASDLFGSMGSFSSAPSGERLVYTDESITVYDSAGNVRVKIGNLA